jgi:hypothetical protein
VCLGLVDRRKDKGFSQEQLELGKVNSIVVFPTVRPAISAMSDHVIDDYVAEDPVDNPHDVDVPPTHLLPPPVEQTYPDYIVQAILRQHAQRTQQEQAEQEQPEQAQNIQHAQQPMSKIKIAPPPRYIESVDLPLDTWLFRMQEYLGNMANTTEGIRTAASYMDGNAAIWWQSVVTSARAMGQEPFDLWEEFTGALRQYLCPGFTVKEDALTKILNHHQGSKSVSSYVAEFTNLKTRCGITDQGMLQHLFTNSLEPTVQYEVSKGQPNNLASAIHLAMKYEVMVNRLNRNHRQPRQQQQQAHQQQPQSRYQQPRQQQQPHRQQQQPRQQQPRAQTAAPRTNGAVPMEFDAMVMPGPLTDEERQRLFAEGGCYRCRAPGHTQFQCPRNNYQGNDNRQ